MKFKNYMILKSVKASEDEESKVLTFKGSDETLDRYGEVMTVNGWDLKWYKKNPVFLWAHDSHSLPIGKAIKVKKEEDGLMFDIEFAVKEYPFAETVYKMYKGGYMNAVSVGFIAKEKTYNPDNGIMTVDKSELLELSAVPVPANPNALQSNEFRDQIEKAVKDDIINLQEASEILIDSKDFLNVNKDLFEKKEDGKEDNIKSFEKGLKSFLDMMINLGFTQEEINTKLRVLVEASDKKKFETITSNIGVEVIETIKKHKEELKGSDAIHNIYSEYFDSASKSQDREQLETAELKSTVSEIKNVLDLQSKQK